jgi:hypothetical protein
MKQFLVELAVRLQQIVEAIYVGLDEVRSTLYAPIHVGLGGKVYDDCCVLYNTRDRLEVTNVTLHESVPRVALFPEKILGIPRVG